MSNISFLLYFLIDFSFAKIRFYFHLNKHFIRKMSKFELFKIAIYPRRYVENLSDRRIVKFCKKYKIIYIYGTGMVAKRCTKDFERLNIKYDGYIVSRLRKEELPDNQKVYELSPEIISDKKTGIVLAVNSFNAKEIMENPLMKQNKDRVFVYDC